MICLGRWINMFCQRARMSRRAYIPCLLTAAVLIVGAQQPAAGQDAQNARTCVGVGDVVEVRLFDRSADGVRAGNIITLPALTVGPQGTFPVPYAGEINAAGRSIPEIQREIAAKLANRAINPGVVVTRLAQNSTGRCVDDRESR
jgi:protein involved in polysaccharide export with SLBB domain